MNLKKWRTFHSFQEWELGEKIAKHTARTARRQLEWRHLLFGEYLGSWTNPNVHYRRWTELLQLRQARDCQIARPALVSGAPVRKLLRHYGGETRHVIWKLNFARESGNCVVVRSCGLDRVCRLSADHRNFTWIDVDEFFKCRREYRILKYEHYVHFTCAEYNALIIDTFTFLDTGNICKKRS